MKNLLLLIFSLLLALPFSSCKDDDDDDIIVNGVVLEHSVDVILIDEDGNDLLDSRIEGAYDPNEIRIYKVVDGEEKLYRQGNLDAPYGVGFADKQEWEALGEDIPPYSYVDLLVTFYDIIENNHSTVIVKWNAAEADTITCEVNPDWYNNINKIYVNGELKWERYKMGDSIWDTLGDQSSSVQPCMHLVKKGSLTN